MYALWYQWNLKEGKARQFREAWQELAEAQVAQGAVAASLHRTENHGPWMAYMLWPSRQHWEAACAQSVAEALLTQRLLDCVDEIWTPQMMKPVAVCGALATSASRQGLDLAAAEPQGSDKTGARRPPGPPPTGTA